MPRSRRGRRTIASINHLDDSEDDDYKIDNSKNDDFDNDEPSEEFEEDLRDATVKSDRHSNNEQEEAEEEEEQTRHEEHDDDDDDDDEDKIHRSHRTRTRKQVNYNEDTLLRELGDEDDELIDDIDFSKKKRRKSDSDSDFGPSNKKSKRTRNSRRHNDDDDEYNIDDAPPPNNDDDFIASDLDDSDDSDRRSSRRQKRQPGFIVKDDDDYANYDENEDYSYNSKRTRASRSGNRNRNKNINGKYGSKRGSSKWSKLLEPSVHNNEDANGNPITLEDELKDLQNDSPLQSPKRNLRHRKEINYTLPSPYLTEAQLEELEKEASVNQNQSSNVSPRKNRGIGRFGGASTTTSSIRRLYPTVGPFGGSEVHSIFQTNTISTNLAALANAESSDSDDENDLIKPTDPNDTAISTVGNNSNNIIATSNNPNSTPFSKKKNTLADTDPLGIDTNIDFSVVGGLENYINQLKEMITLPLLYPEVYSKFHITPPRGVLFHGPPGTGKTLMARALAASCSSQNKKITFFMRKGADCLSKWVGEAERHLRLLFEEAKQQQPSIIFFDEIDGLAPVRSSKQEQIHASIVSTLLALMDGMDNRGQVIIIGATNRPDSIDPALRRPGRFDREFYFPLPDLKAREDILKIHMRKWDDQLDDEFIKELAVLTKGYGGADLRALCTESALNSIQRSYPQIYKVNDKLKIDISKIKANASDFTRALKKIVPNSMRSTSSVSEPLPDFIKPLLENQFDKLLERLHELLPTEKAVSLLEEAEYESLNNDFKTQQIVKRFDSMRTFKPRLCITGLKSQGLKYLSNAVLNKLEGFTIQVLDLSRLYSDSSISVENLCIQLFSELKRHKPSILFIPDVIGLLTTMTDSLRSTIRYLIRGINSNDKILIFVEIEGELTSDLEDEIEELFDISDDEIIQIRDANIEEKSNFFQKFWDSIEITPNEYNDISIRPKKKEKKLEIIENKVSDLSVSLEEKKKLAKQKRELAKKDLRLKNSLKVKLSGLLDIFKARYKRFKKPVIDDAYLVHLFDDIPDPTSNYQLANDKILEISTGKLYSNIDLEVIEERLWNGYYSEPRQFLNDLELILKDANLTGDRDRMLKANEMYAHAVVGIEEIEVQFPQLLEQWKEVSRREKQRNLEYLKIQKEKQAEANEEHSTEKECIDNEAEGAQQVHDTLTSNGDLALTENGVLTNTVSKGTEEVIGEEESEVLKTTIDVDTASPNEDMINGDAPDKNFIEIGENQTQVQGQLQPGQASNGDGDKDLGIGITPVTLSESAEKLEIEKETSVLLHKEADAKVDKGEQIEVDSTEVEEEFVPEKQVVLVDFGKVEELKKLLLLKTENFKLTKLERTNSKLCDLVWKHRLSLDKSSLLEDLESFISGLRT